MTSTRRLAVKLEDDRHSCHAMDIPAYGPPLWDPRGSESDYLGHATSRVSVFTKSVLPPDICSFDRSHEQPRCFLSGKQEHTQSKDRDFEAKKDRLLELYQIMKRRIIEFCFSCER